MALEPVGLVLSFGPALTRSVGRYIFLTKTYWRETPRLRHQLARLLADAGNEVLFFQKPEYLWRNLPSSTREARITVLSHHQLLHHKLRVLPLLHAANARVVLRSLRSALADLSATERDIVVNFNFDYFFLRRAFPKNRIITVINDDFISGALFGYRRPLLWALARTCSSSDRILTVSVPLLRQLSPYGRPELFLPWADSAYRAPHLGAARDTLLFWGYFNERIDLRVVHFLADRLSATRPHIRLWFVGPVRSNHVREAESLRARPNVEILPAASLDELPTDRVLAGLIPYRANDPKIDAVTLPNKGLQLLARGLPLLISALPAMPNFMQAPFVIRMNGDAPAQIDALSEAFAQLQPAIARFVSSNVAGARLRQFLDSAN